MGERRVFSWLWEEGESSFVFSLTSSWSHPYPCYKTLLLTSSLTPSSAIPSWPADSTTPIHTIQSRPWRPPRNFRCFQGGHAGHLPKVTDHMDFISLALVVLQGNLLAYGSISQPRKPKGVKSSFSLSLPTLPDNTRVINPTQDPQISGRTLQLSFWE